MTGVMSGPHNVCPSPPPSPRSPRPARPRPPPPLPFFCGFSLFLGFC